MNLRNAPLTAIFDLLSIRQQKIMLEEDYHIRSMREVLLEYFDSLSEFEKLILGIDYD